MTPPPAPSTLRRLGSTLARATDHALVRWLVAHMIAYPVSLLYGVASVPFVVGALPPSVLGGEAESATREILTWSLAPTLASYCVAHLVALPWALRSTPARAKLYAGALVVMTGAALLAGGLAWARLLYDR